MVNRPEGQCSTARARQAFKDLQKELMVNRPEGQCNTARARQAGIFVKEMKYKAAIFDIDGTLIDTEKTGVLSLMKTIKELLGLEVSYEQAYKYFGIPSSKVAGILGYQGDHQYFSELWEKYFIELGHLIKPFPGVEDMVIRLHNRGYVTGVVTSRNHFEFNKDPFMHRMRPSFDHIVCAEDSPRSKPHPDPVFKFLEMHNSINDVQLTAQDCLFLGDTEHDWQCAHSAGCDFALADWFKRGMQGIAAEYIFTDAYQVLDIFD